MIIGIIAGILIIALSNGLIGYFNNPMLSVTLADCL